VLVTPAGRELFVELRRALSPGVLRQEVVLCFEAWREEFVPCSPAPSSADGLLAEVARFVVHMERRRYLDPSVRVEWPESLARRSAERLLTKHFGSLNEGEHGIRRIASEQGMRALFDVLTRFLEEDALATYLEHRLVLPLLALPSEDWRDLAIAYLAEFRSLPHVATEHPGFLVGRRWMTVLVQHARLVLGWA
jgi:hypothetical protein